MDDQVETSVRSFFRFSEWRGRSTLAGSLFLWRFRLRGSEVPGCDVARLDRAEPPRTPPVIHAAWRPHGRRHGRALIATDAVECPSRAAADEAMLDFLAQFQLPVLEGPVDLGIGDVAFVAPAAAALVFLRANVVVAVRSAGSDGIDVREAAAALDAALLDRPEVDESTHPRGEDVAGHLPRTLSRRGSETPLRLDPEDPDGRALSYKVFASSGEIRLDETGMPVHHAQSDAPARLTVFASAVGDQPAARAVRATLAVPPRPTA